MIIRAEQPQDADAIRTVTEAAFAGTPYSNQMEHEIIDELRGQGALALSLVAEEDDFVVGHVAFTPVRIDGSESGWYGLGPLSVLPRYQGGGIGTALVTVGLELLRRQGAAGCVVLGEPDYYSRFGFKPAEGLDLPGMPSSYFMALPFGDASVTGTVNYHDAFMKCS